MGFKPFKWAKNHPLETAALLATAYFGGPAIMGALEGAGAGAAAASAGTAGTVAGDAFMPGLLAPMAAGSPEALTSALLGTSSMGMGDLFGVGSMAGTGMTPFAEGAVTAAPGATSAFGPSTTAAAAKPWITPEKAMLLGRMTGIGGQQQQPSLTAPPDTGNPWQRPAMATQDAITKKWLLMNDPATYARLYGQPQQGMM